MSSPLPSVSQLVSSVAAKEGADLDRVRVAVLMADQLAALGDEVVTHFVEAARKSGCSWSQIGAELGVSKQAAQQAFVAPTPRRSRFGRRQAEPSLGRLSAEARAVIVGATEEAAAFDHNHVGTEHLLLALGEGPGLAAIALRKLGVDQDAVRGHVEDILGRGTCGRPGARPFTPRTKKILEMAIRESIRLRHDSVRSEHLLLALVREGNGVAPQILSQRLGVNLSSLSYTVLELIKNGGPPTGDEPSTG